MKDRTIKVQHIDNDELPEREWEISITNHNITQTIELNNREFDSLVRQAAGYHISYNCFSTLFRVVEL